MVGHLTVKEHEIQSIGDERHCGKTPTSRVHVISPSRLAHCGRESLDYNFANSPERGPALKEKKMPHETIWEPRGVCQKFRGVVSSPELFDALTEITGDLRAGGVRYVIRDFLDVERFDVGIKTLLEGRALSMAIRDDIPGVAVAAITTSPEVLEAMRVASSYGLDAFPFKTFGNTSDARAWIAESIGEPQP